MTQPTPQPMKATLIAHTSNPIGTLYYVWKQSRHNKPLPTPEQIDSLLNMGGSIKLNPVYYQELSEHEDDRMDGYKLWSKMLGYTSDFQGIKDAAHHIHDEVEMILNESIPVTENISLTFHLENIPISLREQLVRHRIGTQIDPKVGADIVPMGLMEIKQIPDLAESTWWSQTSRVIPASNFYDEGRFILPKSLEGKQVWDDDLTDIKLALENKGLKSSNCTPEFISPQGGFSAKDYYLDTLRIIQQRYRALQAAGVHIEDCRNIVPVGSTHGITWTLNLKAMLHIFGKRSSWIAQIGIWGELMGMMAAEMRRIDPMFGMVLQPQCIKKGKYVGCPVSGTNAERISGVDGMPPCPLWVRYETDNARNAAHETYKGHFPGRTEPAWRIPTEGQDNDVRNWQPVSLVEKEMLERTSEIYSGLWGFNVLEGVPSLEEK